MNVADSKARESLAAAVGEIRETLKSIDAEAKQRHENDAAIQGLVERIAVAKSRLKPGAPDGFAKVTELQNELEARREWAEAHDTTDSENVQTLRTTLAVFVDQVRAVARPIHAAIFAEIMSKLKPYLERDADSAAEFFAANCHACLELVRVINCNWGSRVRTDPIGAATSALKDADALLSGQQFWLRQP